MPTPKTEHHIAALDWIEESGVRDAPGGQRESLMVAQVHATLAVADAIDRIPA